MNIGQKVNIGRISKIVNFHPIDLKFEEDLYFTSLNSTGKLFLSQHRPKGQQRPKVNNSSEISKILNFHPIDLKFEEYLYYRSMNSMSQLFLRPTWTKRSA